MRARRGFINSETFYKCCKESCGKILIFLSSPQSLSEHLPCARDVFGAGLTGVNVALLFKASR